MKIQFLGLSVAAIILLGACESKKSTYTIQSETPKPTPPAENTAKKQLSNRLNELMVELHSLEDSIENQEKSE